MLPPVAERPKLRATLDQLSSAVEDLLLGGLTTATDAARDSINSALQEAARFKLLRFAGTIRTVVDDLGRFARQDPTLSPKRLTTFLNRAWLQSRALAHALEVADEVTFDRLNWTPPTQPVPPLEVVCLGVAKKATVAIVAFDFRLRATTDAGPVKSGQSVSWSVIFQTNKSHEFPPEGYLRVAHREAALKKQNFTGSRFLESSTLTINNANVSGDAESGWRLARTDLTTVSDGKPFADWQKHLTWSQTRAIERITRQSPSPLDLEVELQEEVVLRDYQIGAPVPGDEPGLTVYPVTSGRLSLRALVGAGEEGKALKKSLDELRKRKSVPPLFGLMHYERCRLIFQPLSTFAAAADYMTISKDKVDMAAIVKSLKFT